jgi:hypothetical protein
MLSNAFHAVVSWLLGLSVANAVALGFVAYYVLKNGAAPTLAVVSGAWSKVSGAANVVKVDVASVVTGINSRVATLESDVASIKASLAPKAAAPAAAPVAHVAASDAAPAAHPAAAEPAKA